MTADMDNSDRVIETAPGVRTTAVPTVPTAELIRLSPLSKRLRVVGVSALEVSREEDDILVTYSLGSCIGVSLFDPVARVGGLVHSMMPLSKADPPKARNCPAMYVDSGVGVLLQALFNLGATRRNLRAKVAGGAQILDEKDLFRIGERNYTIVRRILWKNDILISGEDVGGGISRTMYLVMATGQTILRTGHKKVEL